LLFIKKIDFCGFGIYLALKKIVKKDCHVEDKYEEANMLSERKRNLKKGISVVVCLTLSLLVFPLTGKAAADNDCGVLDVFIGVNNPLSIIGQSPLESTVQTEKKKDKTEKEKKDLKDHGNSTSRRGASIVD